MKRIPRISLALERIMTTAETYNDLVTYDSDIRGAGYVADDEEVLVITTRHGYLRLRQEEVPKLASEILYIAEEIERRRR